MNFQDNLSLMKGRLGIYNEPQPQVDSISGVDLQNIRLTNQGGSPQQLRMIKDKKRSLARSLKYSYQGADIRKLNDTNIYRALINPDKLKQNYDDKIISTQFETGLAAGDIFEWVNTNSYWIVYLQELTELAYFRSEIRRCRWKLEWIDNGVKKTTYAAVRGPVETKINYIAKNGLSVDTPNHSLSIYVPATEDNIAYFKRYSKFYLQNDQHRFCWRVEGTDYVSSPGVLEIVAVEYYANEQQDEKDISDVAMVSEINQKAEMIEIKGESFIKPKIAYTYTVAEDLVGSWNVDKQYPVKIEINDSDDHKVSLKWLSNYSGQFELSFGDYKKTIVVESLF